MTDTKGRATRPLEHLAAAGKVYPNAWQQVDTFRNSRGVDLPKWPAWCFMPMAAWYAIVSEGGAMPFNRVADVARLAAIGTWRYTQGIYEFDPDVSKSLTSSLVKGDIPAEVLYRLPEWSLYIRTPGETFTGIQMHGFWVHLEWDTNTERSELRFLLDTEKSLIPQIMHIGPWTVTEAVDRWRGEADRQRQIHKLDAPELGEEFVELFAGALQPLLARVIYLCSDEPEIEDLDELGAYPGRPKPKRTKRGWRLFPAKKPRIWRVATETGEILRKANFGDPTGRTVSPHIRRAHWHGFWRGTGDQRRFTFKWLPPIVVDPQPKKEGR